MRRPTHEPTTEGESSAGTHLPLVQVRTRLRFIYAWGFTAGSASQTGDDIGVSAPTVAKTA
ncbi:hypothetical protein ACFPRL_23940 [Pseudoclavibacter helvolus]